VPPPHNELWLSIVSKVTLLAWLSSHDSPPEEQLLNPQPPEYGSELHSNVIGEDKNHTTWQSKTQPRVRRHT